MNESNIDIEVIHNLINDREYVHYHYNGYAKIVNKDLNSIYFEKLDAIKNDLKSLRDISMVDYKKLNMIFKININYNLKYYVDRIEITLVIPLLDVKSDTIIKKIILDKENNFNINIDELISEIIEETEYKLVDNIDFTKYKYLVIEEEKLSILLSIVCRYFVENQEIVNSFRENPKDKFLIEVLNCNDYSTKEIDLFRDYCEEDYIFKNIVCIESENNINSFNKEGYLCVKKIYNYASLVNFDSGKINMNLLLRDTNKKLYKMKYVTTIQHMMKHFYVSKKFHNSILLELNR